MGNLNLEELCSEELNLTRGGECLYGDLMTLGDAIGNAWDNFSDGFSAGFADARSRNSFN